MATAITFTRGGTTVAFSAEEIRRIEVSPFDRIEMRRTQTHSPHLYAAGQGYREVRATFIAAYGDTLNRVASVCDGALWTCAYRAGEDPDDTIDVRATTDSIGESYVGIVTQGSAAEANRTVSVTFVEAVD